MMKIDKDEMLMALAGIAITRNPEALSAKEIKDTLDSIFEKIETVDRRDDDKVHTLIQESLDFMTRIINQIPKKDEKQQQE